jgi:CRP-like cAMP-binding protein
MTDWQINLSSVFQAKLTISDEAVSELLSRWSHPVALSRNDFLIRKDQTETRLFYVLDGSLRIYYPHHEEEICVGFAHDHNLICSYPSFIDRKPSAYYIQALRKTSLMAILRTDFYSLLETYRSVEQAWRMLEEEALLGKIEREVEMLTFTPHERYKRLLERSPSIFQRIPRKYIASYLRMTPETLSRIRPE